MNFKNLNDDQKKEFSDLLFEPLNSPEELQLWIYSFFGLWFPYGTVDPDSTSSPLHAIWTAYEIYKHNKGNETAGLIICSCRAGIKTLAVAIFEVLSIMHFNITVAHMSSLESQSSISIKYIEGFFRAIAPLLEFRGWRNTSQNKRTIEYMNEKDDTVFIKVIIATKAGANSSHTNCLALDELDLCPDDVIAESSFIPVYSKGIYPIKIFLSSLKWSFGPMVKAMDSAAEKKYKILKWNVIDVTEKCPESRHLPDLPKEDRYVAKALPLKQISVDEFKNLAGPDQLKYSLIKDAHAGCAKCPLLPVCKMGLSKRPAEDTGGLFKPIDATIQQFLESSSELAESQLLCWKPGRDGMVYPRFSSSTANGNVITLNDAYESFMGFKPDHNISEAVFLAELKKANIPIYAAVDWGYTHHYVILIAAILPTGEILILDCFSSPGLEFSDCLEIAKTYRDKYEPMKWYVDQAMPSSIKSFNRNGMNCPKFNKDVLGGVEAVRSKIINAAGKRLLKILQVDSTRPVISALNKHRFKIDTSGEVTIVPDDESGVSDICDTLRYLGQNAFPVRGSQRPEITALIGSNGELPPELQHSPEQNDLMAKELEKVTGKKDWKGTPGGRGNFRFTF